MVIFPNPTFLGNILYIYILLSFTYEFYLGLIISTGNIKWELYNRLTVYFLANLWDLCKHEIF